MVQLTIGDLAARAGVPTSTVRYYERSGLVRPAARSRANYRLYDDDTVERLRFIRASQSAGLTLADIKTLLEFRDGVTAPCKEIRPLIEKRLARVREHLRELRHVQNLLTSYARQCQTSDDDEPCHVLGKLTNRR